VTRQTYELLKQYMLTCMDPEDCSHGAEHIYRVLHAALDIAAHEEGVNTDVLICACLLHDIGRQAQAGNPSLCHARVGAEMAREFLMGTGFGAAFSDHVADCIRAHRYRGEAAFGSIEAKILYDADKLDAAGAMGVARTLLYGGKFDEPMYTRNADGEIEDGTGDGPDSFMHEYHFKLSKIYNRFNTARAAAIAEERRQNAARFYEALLNEARSLDIPGRAHLNSLLEDISYDA